jgi:phospholipase C
VQPSNRPSGFGSNTLPLINDTDPTKPGYETNIGDKMSAKDISWNWYAGGWDNAAGNIGGPGWTNGTAPVPRTYTDASGTHTNTNGCADPATAPTTQFPYCNDPLFQFHHQPFNYFAGYAPGQPGRTHLRDEAAFIAAAHNGTLPSVSFVKPIGEDNEHPGYASTNAGESHLVDLVKAVETGPDANHTLILVTYDEFGGSWDHVAPPGQGNTTGPSDSFGPGTRIPAIVIGKAFEHDGVDHPFYDTTSILATLEHTYGLTPLSTRDAQVNDLRNVLRAATG